MQSFAQIAFPTKTIKESLTTQKNLQKIEEKDKTDYYLKFEIAKKRLKEIEKYIKEIKERKNFGFNSEEVLDTTETIKKSIKRSQISIFLLLLVFLKKAANKVY